MRSIIAALLGAAATLPTLARATSPAPDPADPAAPVPALAFPSVTDDLDGSPPTDHPSWRQLNQAVQDAPADDDMQPGDSPNPSGGGAMPAHSMHGETDK